MKKLLTILSLVVLGSLVLTLSAFAVEVKSFNDITSSHLNYDAVHFLYNVDFVEGYAVDGEDFRDYRPDNNINRAEFLTLMINGTGVATLANYESCFTDVPADEWFTTFICQAKDEGWVDGHPDGSFKPGDDINLVEALKILGEMSDWEIGDPAEGEEWYQPYFDIAEDLNIVLGILPGDEVTRADVAEMIFRVIAIQTMILDTFEDFNVAETYEYYGVPFVDIGDDTADDVVDDVVEGGVITQDGPASANGVDEIMVSVTLKNDDGSAALAHTLEGMVMTPHTISRYEAMEKIGGVYEFPVSTYGAGTFAVYMRDMTTGEVYNTNITFEPGAPSYIEVLEVAQPVETEDHKGYVTAVVKDEYGNTVRSGDGASLAFESTIGNVSDVEYSDEYGAWSASVDTTAWGNAVVTVYEEGDPGITEMATLSFDGVMFDVPAAIGVGETFDVPVYVNMGAYGSLGEYGLSFSYNSDYLTYVSVIDGTGGDEFNAPTVSVDVNEVVLNQVSNTGAATGQYIHVATMQFQATDLVGPSTIALLDVGLVNIAEELIDVLFPDEEVITVKGTKQVCVDVYTLEGADESSAEEVTDAAEYAELIYKLEAMECDCPYYLDIKVNHEVISKALWQFIGSLSGTDGETEDDVIEEIEMDEIAFMFAEDNDCVQMFFVPQLEVGDDDEGDSVMVGWSSVGEGTDYIAIDYSRDDDGSVFAHELTHMLSGNDVEDYDPNGDAAERVRARAQGADRPGNLMNYDDPGIDLTAEQCALIDWASLPTLY